LQCSILIETGFVNQLNAMGICSSDLSFSNTCSQNKKYYKILSVIAFLEKRSLLFSQQQKNYDNPLLCRIKFVKCRCDNTNTLRYADYC